jgi:hypothetical protein
MKNLTQTLKIILCAASALGFLWYLLALQYVLYGLQGLLANAIGLYPLIYLGYCFFSCFKFISGRVLVISGVIANLGLLPLIVWSLSHKGEELIAVIFIAFIIMWTLMCIGRIQSEKKGSGFSL